MNGPLTSYGEIFAEFRRPFGCGFSGCGLLPRIPLYANEPEKLEHVPIHVLSWKLDDAPRKLEPQPVHEHSHWHEQLSLYESVHVKRI